MSKKRRKQGGEAPRPRHTHEQMRQSLYADQVLAKIKDHKDRVMSAMVDQEIMIDLLNDDVVQGYEVMVACMAIGIYYLDLVESGRG